MSSFKKVLISTDPGIDDCLALILALNSKDSLRVSAINATYGNVSAGRALENLLNILELANEKELPQIGRGANGPLKKRDICTRRRVHGRDGLGGINLAQARIRPPVKKAGDLIEESIINGVDTVISLAPLTDLAKAFSKNRRLAKKINEFFIMGGALRVPGSINGFAEFNFYSDPEAADFVLGTGAPIILVSFDVTTKAVLKEKDIAKFQTKDKPIFQLIAHIAKYYIKYYMQRKHIDGAYMHDPLTVGLAIDRSICTYEKISAGVDCKKDIGRLILKKGKPNIKFAHSVDGSRFLNMFLNRLTLGGTK